MIKHRNEFGAIILTILLAGACVGDGIMFVSGRVVTEEGVPLEGCQMNLFIVGDEEPWSGGEIEPVFYRDFVISPSREEYFLRIACPGRSGTYQSPVFSSRGDTYASKPRELGTVIIAR